MKRFLVAAFTVSMMSTVACSDPTKGKPAATVGEAKPDTKTDTKTPETPAAGAMTYEITPANSKVAFEGAKITKTHPGNFEKFTGTIVVNEKNPEKSQINVEIEVASMKTDDEGLTKHLMSPDFFDAEKFPKAVFTSTAIKAGGENGATHTIEGNLEMHGQKKGISFPAKVTVSDTEATATAEFSIQRADWGITYPGMAEDAIKPGVLMKLDIKATAKK